MDFAHLGICGYKHELISETFFVIKKYFFSTSFFQKLEENEEKIFFSTSFFFHFFFQKMEENGENIFTSNFFSFFFSFFSKIGRK